MGIAGKAARGLGFPDIHDMGQYFGFVTDEEKARFERVRDARADRVEAARERRSISGQMLMDSMKQANRLSRDGIQAKLVAAETSARREQENDGPEL